MRGVEQAGAALARGGRSIVATSESSRWHSSTTTFIPARTYRAVATHERLNRQWMRSASATSGDALLRSWPLRRPDHHISRCPSREGELGGRVVYLCPRAFRCEACLRFFAFWLISRFACDSTSGCTWTYVLCRSSTVDAPRYGVLRCQLWMVGYKHDLWTSAQVDGTRYATAQSSSESSRTEKLSSTNVR